MSRLLAFALGWYACNESKKEDIFVLHYVAEGGCLKDFVTAMRRCRFDNRPDAEACINATAALRKCFARKPHYFGDYFTGRIDNGLDQDTNPTAEEIQEDKRQGNYRWWAGMRRN